MTDPTELSRWIGLKAIDPSGDKVGTISDIYVDDATGEAEWLAVLTGWFGSRISFVPLLNASAKDDEVGIGYAKDVVKDAPRIEVDGNLSVDEEKELYRHYGLSYSPKLESSEDGAEALQGNGSASVSAEVTPEVAVARLRRREDADMAAMGFDDEN